MSRFASIVAALLLVVVAAFTAAAATREDRFFNRSYVGVFTGDASCDLADQDWTSYAAVCTITPASGTALHDVQVVIDLAKASTGFAAGHTSQTITFSVARKVDGTNYRNDAQLVTTAISGTNAASSSVTLNVGTVGVTECVSIRAKLSTESSAADFDLPVLVYYQAPAPPTIGVVE
jgi:hypothetical protein